MRRTALVFARGTRHGGGSGFENLVDATKEAILEAEIVGVISSVENGGVHERAKRLGVPYGYLSKLYHPAQAYRALRDQFNPDFVLLSGWTLPVLGLDPRTTLNIHPGPLPEFGGKGMHGKHVHEAVLAAYHRGELTHSAVSMHFVDAEYDHGPVFFREPVEILPGDTVRTLQARVNDVEHYWQPRITDMVMKGEIAWDGSDPGTLVGAVIN
jgi:phosphoribosylglycinamide formyltransferase 1